MAAEVDTRTSDAIPQKTATPEATTLSQSVFANPEDFLSTLQQILPKANPNSPDNVSKQDLINYSQHGDNATDREAAGIAANHFDELNQLPSAYVDQDGVSPNTGLSSLKIFYDQDLVSNNYQGDVAVAQYNDVGAAQPALEVALASGILAGGLIESGPPSLFFGAIALGAGSWAGKYYTDYQTTPGRADAAAAQAQRDMPTWIK